MIRSAMPRMDSSSFIAFSSMAFPRERRSSTNSLSSSPAAFILTFKKAPLMHDLSARAPTAASLTELGLPFSAISLKSSKAGNAASIILNGTMHAFFVASAIAAFLTSISSSVFFGRAKAPSILLKASVSSSTNLSSLFWISFPFPAHSENSFQR